MNLKKLLHSVVPEVLQRWYSRYKQRALLGQVPTASCNPSRLRPASGVEPEEIFKEAVKSGEWDEVRRSLEPFAIPDGTGGVNRGDRRAIYYLLRHFGPKSILEVGTHIGASSVHVASALGRNETSDGQFKKLVSVDIADVNDPNCKPWLKAGSTFSPREMIEKLGYDAFVEFETGSSLDHFAGGATYDFIFLDGDHSAKTVYQEVPAALQALNPGGVILLHDYYPDLRPLWPSGAVIQGPFLAIERLKKEGASLAVVPLGNVPWPTKQGSNTTSLALLLGPDA